MSYGSGEYTTRSVRAAASESDIAPFAVASPVQPSPLSAPSLALGSAGRVVAGMFLLLTALAVLILLIGSNGRTTIAYTNAAATTPQLVPSPAEIAAEASHSAVSSPAADRNANSDGNTDSGAAPFTFPADFEFGTATSAYQVEGAATADGRGASIWDVFSKEPGRTANGDTGDVAIDQYNRYVDDIELMRSPNGVLAGIKFYRFSISPTRILPTGQLPVNPAGIEHYNRLIDALLKAGIKPFVTLYHWDLSQNLHDSYGGWLDRRSITDFELYADVCFKAFGDRVTRWLTFNEPWTFSWLGYGAGTHAPGRCSECVHAPGAVNPIWKPNATATATASASVRPPCKGGDTATEPYTVAHHVLIAHSRAVDLYRRKYAPSQRGEIGITLNCDWNVPLDASSSHDRDAAARAVDFQLGWFADPVYFGDYPNSMREFVGKRLPRFTQQEAALLKGSADFFGLNHYTTAYTTRATHKTCDGWQDDRLVNTTFIGLDGKEIGPAADVSWLRVVPSGIRHLLKHVHDRYHKPNIFVTENGVAVPNESALPLAAALNDTFRVDYYRSYLTALAEAIKYDHVRVSGYAAWSAFDNFEWSDGYTKRFGLIYVDYNTLARHPKQSAAFFGALASGKTRLRV